MQTAAILGCAGYAGQETLDRVLAHPALEAIALGSDSLAGQPAHALDPRLDPSLPAFVPNAEAAAAGADVIFLCLDNDEAASFQPPADTVVVDLSGVHRLADPDLARAWYGVTPGAWSFGLPELYPAHGPLIANPGCYATAALLALGPLAGAIETAIVDAKSGVSGAGKTLKASSHAGSVLENFSPYAVGAHRHAPEIAQQLGFPVCFVPHLLPVRRGLLATCYVQTGADVRALLDEAYAGSDVVRVLPEGVTPELARVQGSDAAEIGVFADQATGTAIVICALDNLGKGAAGQAVQNANLALGLVGDRRAAAPWSPGLSVTAAKGFVASGVHAQIRREKRDLALLRSLVPATGAAMWTRNRVQAAPVVVSKRHLAAAEPQAVVINSGVANAATGAQGERDAVATAEHAARLLGLTPEQIVILSTGVIGAPLPVDRVIAGLDAAAPALSADGGDDAADAILTTDTKVEGRGVARRAASSSAGWRRAPG